ncbi:hypothetical protein QJQ45_027378, partial [Haematococcus lacustris]
NEASAPAACDQSWRSGMQSVIIAAAVYPWTDIHSAPGACQLPCAGASSFYSCAWCVAALTVAVVVVAVVAALTQRCFLDTGAIPQPQLSVPGTTRGQEASQQQVLRRLIKQSQSLDELHAILQQHTPEFDVTHVSQALCRLALSVVQRQAWLVQGGMDRTQALTEAMAFPAMEILALLDTLTLSLAPHADCRAVGNALWAYSRMEHFNQRIFDALCSQALRLQGQLRPGDCAQIMLAFGVFKRHHPDLLAAIPQIMLPCMYDTRSEFIVQVLWGFARLGIPGTPSTVLMEAACDTLCYDIRLFKNQEIALLMWSLAKLQHTPSLHMLQLVERRMLGSLGRMGTQARRMRSFAPRAVMPESTSQGLARDIHCKVASHQEMTGTPQGPSPAANGVASSGVSAVDAEGSGPSASLPVKWPGPAVPLATGGTEVISSLSAPGAWADALSITDSVNLAAGASWPTPQGPDYPPPPPTPTAPPPPSRPPSPWATPTAQLPPALSPIPSRCSDPLSTPSLHSSSSPTSPPGCSPLGETVGPWQQGWPLMPSSSQGCTSWAGGAVLLPPGPPPLLHPPSQDSTPLPTLSYNSSGLGGQHGQQGGGGVGLSRPGLLQGRGLPGPPGMAASPAAGQSEWGRRDAAILVPQDIANLLWAFGRMRYKAATLLDELPLHLRYWKHAFTATDLCSVLCGYAHARHYHEGMLNTLSPLLASRLPSLKLRELSTVLWAFGIFQHQPHSAPHLLDVMAEAVIAQLEHSKPQALAMIVKACANLRCCLGGQWQDSSTYVSCMLSPAKLTWRARGPKALPYPTVSCYDSQTSPAQPQPALAPAASPEDEVSTLGPGAAGPPPPSPLLSTVPSKLDSTKHAVPGFGVNAVTAEAGAEMQSVIIAAAVYPWTDINSAPGACQLPCAGASSFYSCAWCVAALTVAVVVVAVVAALTQRCFLDTGAIPQPQLSVPGTTRGQEASQQQVLRRLIKQSQSLDELHAILQQHTPEFDVTHVSQALCRLALSVVQRQAWLVQGGMDRTQALTEAMAFPAMEILALLDPLTLSLAPYADCRAVGNALWAYSRMEHFNQRIFDTLCSQALRLQGQLRPGDCAQIMLAFGVFKRHHPDLLAAIPQIMLPSMYETRSEFIVQVLWGFARLGIPGTPSTVLMEAACDTLCYDIRLFKNQELALLMWSLAKLQHTPSLHMLQLVERRMLGSLGRMGTQARRMRSFAPRAVMPESTSQGLARDIHCKVASHQEMTGTPQGPSPAANGVASSGVSAVDAEGSGPSASLPVKWPGPAVPLATGGTEVISSLSAPGAWADALSITDSVNLAAGASWPTPQGPDYPPPPPTPSAPPPPSRPPSPWATPTAQLPPALSPILSRCSDPLSTPSLHSSSSPTSTPGCSPLGETVGPWQQGWPLMPSSSQGCTSWAGGAVLLPPGPPPLLHPPSQDSTPLPTLSYNSSGLGGQHGQQGGGGVGLSRPGLLQGRGLPGPPGMAASPAAGQSEWGRRDAAILVPQDIANLLWAFGRMRYKAATLLDELPLHLRYWKHAFTATDLCSVLCGYAHARHYHEGMLNTLSPLLASRLPSLELRELSTVLWAFGIFQHQPPSAPHLLDVMAEAVIAQLEHSKPQALAMIVKACANLRFRHPALLTHICSRAKAQLPEFSPHELSTLLYGLSHLAHTPLHTPSPPSPDPTLPLDPEPQALPFPTVSCDGSQPSPAQPQPALAPAASPAGPGAAGPPPPSPLPSTVLSKLDSTQHAVPGFGDNVVTAEAGHGAGAEVEAEAGAQGSMSAPGPDAQTVSREPGAMLATPLPEGHLMGPGVAVLQAPVPPAGCQSAGNMPGCQLLGAFTSDAGATGHGEALAHVWANGAVIGDPLVQQAGQGSPALAVAQSDCADITEAAPPAELILDCEQSQQQYSDLCPQTQPGATLPLTTPLPGHLLDSSAPSHIPKAPDTRHSPPPPCPAAAIPSLDPSMTPGTAAASPITPSMALAAAPSPSLSPSVLLSPEELQLFHGVLQRCILMLQALPAPGFEAGQRVDYTQQQSQYKVSLTAVQVVIDPDQGPAPTAPGAGDAAAVPDHADEDAGEDKFARNDFRVIFGHSPGVLLKPPWPWPWPWPLPCCYLPGPGPPAAQVLNSVVFSCLRVGLAPWDLIELAETKGLRLHQPSQPAPHQPTKLQAPPSQAHLATSHGATDQQQLQPDNQPLLHPQEQAEQELDATSQVASDTDPAPAPIPATDMDLLSAPASTAIQTIPGVLAAHQGGLIFYTPPPAAAVTLPGKAVSGFTYQPHHDLTSLDRPPRWQRTGDPSEARFGPPQPSHPGAAQPQGQTGGYGLNWASSSSWGAGSSRGLATRQGGLAQHAQLSSGQAGDANAQGAVSRQSQQQQQQQTPNLSQPASGSTRPGAPSSADQAGLRSPGPSLALGMGSLRMSETNLLPLSSWDEEQREAGPGAGGSSLGQQGSGSETAGAGAGGNTLLPRPVPRAPSSAQWVPGKRAVAPTLWELVPLSTPASSTSSSQHSPASPLNLDGDQQAAAVDYATEAESSPCQGAEEVPNPLLPAGHSAVGQGAQALPAPQAEACSPGLSQSQGTGCLEGG